LQQQQTEANVAKTKVEFSSILSGDKTLPATITAAPAAPIKKKLKRGYNDYGVTCWVEDTE